MSLLETAKGTAAWKETRWGREVIRRQAQQKHLHFYRSTLQRDGLPTDQGAFEARESRQLGLAQHHLIAKDSTELHQTVESSRVYVCVLKISDIGTENREPWPRGYLVPKPLS